jgi:hypothetical protein
LACTHHFLELGWKSELAAGVGVGFDVAWAVDDVGEDLAADVGGEAEEGGVLLVECGCGA